MKGKIGGLILTFLIGLSIWGIFQNTEMNLPMRLASPSLIHPLGLDQNGSDQTFMKSKGLLQVPYSHTEIYNVIDVSQSRNCGTSSWRTCC